MNTNWKKRAVVWAIHIIGWATIFMLPYIFMHEEGGGGLGPRRYSPTFSQLDIINNCLWMGVFYFNALVLVPRFFYAKKYVLYIASVVLSFVVIILLHTTLIIPIIFGRQTFFLRSLQRNLVPFLFTVIASAAYEIIYDKFKADATAATLQKENLKTELSFLRSQVSPHFLFNVLNNIVAMVRLKSEELEPTVLKLSSLLQYMLYESSDEKVLLKNEVDCLHDYIDLQKLRFSSQLQLNMQFDVGDGWQSIEPMLLIPFVENAFKHGNVFDEVPEITIKLLAEENTLHFQVKNKYVALDKAKDKTSGIGLTNVKRRLQLLYPNRHELLIEDKNGFYDVHLKLQLQ